MKASSKLITADNVCGIFSNLSRVYEIALLGDFVIKIHKGNNIDGDSLSDEDIKFIIKFFSHNVNIFSNNFEQYTVLNLELNKPDLSELFSSYKKNRSESINDIISRVETAKKNEKPEFKLNEAGYALFKTAYQRLNLSISECEAIAETACIIAQLAGSNTIRIEHLAEAIQYQSIDKSAFNK